VEIRKINKIFPGTQALTDIDLEFIDGEIHAIVGPNGSGKSTLMNIIAGAFPPTSGEIFLNREKVKFDTPQQAIAQKIVMVHQELRLFSPLTVAENIMYGRFPRTRIFKIIDWKAMRKLASEHIKQLNPNISMDAKVSSLSIAEQQMVEIAKALSQDAKLLILDEPTASLSVEEVNTLFKVLKNLKSRGITIIFISHRIDEVLAIADRITVLRDSRLIDTLENTPDLKKETIVMMMINREIDLKHRKKASNLKSSDVALKVSGLNFQKRLFDINFEVRKGEVLGIAGLVGAGRTELLKCIFGAYNSWTGRIELNGKQFHAKSPGEAVKNKIAYISEDRKLEGLVLLMPIKDNMIMASFKDYSVFALIDRKRSKAIVDQKIKELNLICSSDDAIVQSLSGGNQQKVVLAKWLIANSDIILMDEPTRGIDVGAKNDVYILIEQLAAAGKSIIFVSSELEEVIAVSDRILVLNKGNVVAEFDNVDIRIKDIMTHAVKKNKEA
jgi:ABC-type sugar transport system ATPase subunit